MKPKWYQFYRNHIVKMYRKYFIELASMLDDLPLGKDVRLERTFEKFCYYESKMLRLGYNVPHPEYHSDKFILSDQLFNIRSNGMIKPSDDMNKRLFSDNFVSYYKQLFGESI